MDEENASYFQQQIGALRWLVELGKGDIMREVSALAAHTALPREGHLGAVLCLYAYLKQHPKCEPASDPRVLPWKPHQSCDRSNFYRTDDSVLDDNPDKP